MEEFAIEQTKKEVLEEARSSYIDSNIKSRSVLKTQRAVFSPKDGGRIKEKFVESTTYSNGVVKNKLIGSRSDGKLQGRDR